jgi:hypothetical protein
MLKKSSVPDSVKSFPPFSPPFTPVTMRLGPYAKLQNWPGSVQYKSLKNKMLVDTWSGGTQKKTWCKDKEEASKQASSHGFVTRRR